MGTLYQKIFISEEKGYGVIATADIPRGTVILAEAPLFQYPKASASGVELQPSAVNDLITKAVSKLSAEKRAAFLDLHKAQSKATSTAPPFLAIGITNGFGLGGDSTETGIFEIASRFNHSCLPNAQHVWKAGRKVMEVRAMSDIAEGAEITMCYLSLQECFQQHNPRQALLEHRYGFRCDCGACKGPEVATRDQRRSNISKMDDAVGGGMLIAINPARTLKYCRQVLQLLPLESFQGELPRVYFDAFQVVLAHGDLARASAFMKLKIKFRRLYEGDDASDLTPEHNAWVERPQSHYVYRAISNQWSTSLSMRREEDSAGFEEWLWLRAEK